MKTGIFYGSTTGVTENVAKKVGELLGADVYEASDLSRVEDYDRLILASSTWGMGELQDTWIAALDELMTKNLNGKTVAFIGAGDGAAFGDTFVDAIGIIYEDIKDKGIVLVGQTSTDGYDFSASKGILDGDFLGLVIDENNQGDLTDERIKAWVEKLGK
ncbi:flavodoxin [Fusobacterium sp. PH5-44]|uniref:flavodoxin n=1 Tax=unclassified Fusobacterium TaxID=2648384 RepID=UPI003D1B48AA